MATPEDKIYGSKGLIDTLARILRNHRVVGDDFPDARPGLIANLEALQAALPAAICEIREAARANV